MDARLEIAIKVWREVWFAHKSARGEVAQKYLSTIEAMDENGIFDALTPVTLENEAEDELTPCLIALLYAYCARTVDNYKEEAP